MEEMDRKGAEYWQARYETERAAHEETRAQVAGLRERVEAGEVELRLCDRLLRGLVAAMNCLMSREQGTEENIRRAFAHLGEAADVDRMYFFEISEDTRHISLRYEWVREGIRPFIDDPGFKNFAWLECFQRWYDVLGVGGVIAGDVADLPESEQEILLLQDIQSLLVAPCRAGGRLWGFIGFDMCRSRRRWHPAEVRILQGASDSIGLALGRARALEDLDAFAHTVAHELKAPLGTLASVAGLLGEEHAQLSSAQRDELLLTIRESSRRAVGMVGEILSFARARLEDVVIHAVDVQRVLESVLRRYEDDIEERGAVVLCENRLHPGLGYEPWLEDILANLVSNALKYGGKPPLIRIGSSLRANGMVEYFVADCGPGLPEEYHPVVFDPFFRYDPEGHGGHGLGLSIVRRMTERFGGTVGFENLKEGGARFSFSLRQVSEE